MRYTIKSKDRDLKFHSTKWIQVGFMGKQYLIHLRWNIFKSECICLEKIAIKDDYSSY